MKSLRTLFPFLKPYRRKSLIALFLLTSLVFMDLAIPRLIQRLIDEGINKQDGAVVLQTSLIMLAISAISTIFAIGNNYFSVQVGEGVARDVREVLFLKIQAFSYGNLDRFTTGKLLVRLTSDAGAVQRLVQISLRIGTRAPLLMIGSLILMFATDVHLALTILPLLVLTSIVIVIFSFQMEPRYRVVQQKLDALNTVLQENIAGARLVKAFVRGSHEEARFGVANEEFSDRTIQVTQYMSVMGPVLSIFVNIGMVMVVYMGGMQAIQGNLTDGQIVAFTNYLLTTMGPLLMMTVLSNVWAAGLASTQRINGVLDTEPDVQNLPAPQLLPVRLHGRVEFQNVCFAYAPGEGESVASGEEGTPETVLEDINVVIEPGTRVAILGATGAGKTSLVNLVPRFYDVTSGRVLIDGVDVREYDQAQLRRQIAIVPQEAILFSGNVRDNIRYGHPQATDAEVEAAARAAQAHDFVMRLPQQYETHVEERGVNLSGGQKQRLSIARAMLVRPAILILDDSTSAVDVETETRIQAALDEWMADRTTIVVAQRISTVLTADKILVLDRGRLAAEGSHAELMVSSPIYREIYDSQLGNGLALDSLAPRTPTRAGLRGPAGLAGLAGESR
jgi:ATP-binding cassette subfamily B multidrug efflux pump